MPDTINPNTETRTILFETPDECPWEFLHEELGGVTVFQRVLFKELDSSSFSMTLYQKIEGQAAFEETFVIQKPFHWKTIYESYSSSHTEYDSAYPLKLRALHIKGFERWQTLLMQYLFGATEEFWEIIEDEEDIGCRFSIDHLYHSYLKRMSESQVEEIAKYLFRVKTPLQRAASLLDLFSNYGNKTLSFENRPFSEILQIAQANKVKAHKRKELCGWWKTKEKELCYLTDLKECKNQLENIQRKGSSFVTAIRSLSNLNEIDCQRLVTYFILSDSELEKKWAAEMLQYLTETYEEAKHARRYGGWPNMQLPRVKKQIAFWSTIFTRTASEKFKAIYQ